MNNETKVCAKVFETPGKEFHIRSLARQTGLNPNTIINITNKLEKEGMLKETKDKETNRVLIKADTENKLYRLKKREYNIQKIAKSGLVEFLEEKLAYPTIILFGSYAKAESHEHSDIDLFIITKEKKEPDTTKYARALGANIQLFVHTKSEFDRMKKTSPELINNVLNGVILSGFLEVF
jgi:predicted nucleotidyltransferase